MEASSSKRLVNTRESLLSTTIENPRSLNVVSSISGVEVLAIVGVGGVSVIPKVIVGSGELVGVGAGIVVAVAGRIVGVGVEDRATSAEAVVSLSDVICCGVAVEVGRISELSEQARVPITNADNISLAISWWAIFL